MRPRPRDDGELLATKPAPAALRPDDEAALGALRAGAALSIQSRHAQRLVAGRRRVQGKPAITGLLGFATLLRPIWAGAKAGDPYADWWLCQVHEHMGSVEQWLEREQVALAEMLASIEAVDIGIAAVAEPLRVPLAFANPYGYRGAYLLAAYDRWVCTVLTVGHVGLRPGADVQRSLHRGGRALRRVYASPLGYRQLGITREDVRTGTANAARARAAMGALPEAVLRGERRAPYAPPLGAERAPSSPSPFAPHPRD